MANLELIALNESTPQLLAPTSGDIGVIVGGLRVDGATTLASLAITGGLTLDTTLSLGSGSITDSSGAIDFGNENLSTTGTLSTGALTPSSIVGWVIGTDVQAWDTQLDDIAALALTDGNIIVGNGTNWVAESGATARTSLGATTVGNALFIAATEAAAQQAISVEVGVDVQAYSATTNTQKNNDAATVAPAVTDDNTAGYSVNSQWTDTTADVTYFCLDTTTGAAVWQSVGSGGSGGVGGGDDIVGFENDVATTGGGTGSYTITTNKNMVTAGTLTITAGDTITVPSGSTWTIV